MVEGRNVTIRRSAKYAYLGRSNSAQNLQSALAELETLQAKCKILEYANLKPSQEPTDNRTKLHNVAARYKKHYE